MVSNRIYVDVTELSVFDKGTGIQRVTRAIFTALKNRPPLGWEVIAVRGDPKLCKFIRVRNLSAYSSDLQMEVQSEDVVDLHLGDVFLSLDLTYNINQGLNLELQSGRKRGAKVYFVIYDLIPLMYPEWFIGNNDWFEGNDYLKLFQYWFECAIQSDGLICISKAVQDDVSIWITKQGYSQELIPEMGFFHLGADKPASQQSTDFASDWSQKLQILKSVTTFLLVGTVEPRKGHQLALEAVEKLWDEGVNVNLVFVGKQGWKVDKLAEKINMHPRLDKQLFWFSGISDEYLSHIYESSSVLLALSEAEGFGLPLVEAANYQMPIIARDIPVFREVCKDGAYYFDGRTNEDLYFCLKNWITHCEQDTHPKSNEIQVLSWDESAAQLMKVVEDMSGISFNWAINE